MHIPKTGGITVEQFLRDSVGSQEIAPYDRVELIMSRAKPDFGNYRYYCAHAPAHVRQLLPQPVILIAWMRDPIDRAISAYNHILRDPYHPSHDRLLAETTDFESAVRHPRLRVHFLEAMTRYFGSDIDLSTFEENFEAASIASAGASETQPDKYTFARAKEMLRKFDFIGFCDRMEHDCRLLARLLGLDMKATPQLLNTDPGEPTCRPRIARNAEVEALLTYFSPFDIELYQLAQKMWPALPGHLTH